MIAEIIPFKEENTEDLLTMIKEFYLLEKIPYEKEILRGCLKEMLKNPSLGMVRIAMADGAAAGYFVLTFGYSLEYHGRNAVLDEFYVREEFRGKGIGTQCLNYIDEYCKAENIIAVHLVVDKINLKAKDLYDRKGYVIHDRYLMSKWIEK